MDGRIIKNRIKAVQRQLNRRQISCLVVSKPANVTYTTGFSGDDSWAVITQRAAYLITDSRYTEQAHNQCRNCRIIQRSAPMAETAAALAGKLKSVKSITVEKSICLTDFEALKKQVKGRLKSAAGIIEQLRSVKDSGEIAAIKAAVRIAGQVLKKTRRHIKTGITENELAGILDLQIRRAAAVNSFDSVVAFGPNASRPHHQPGSRKLKKNDYVLIDFGVKYKGYCCDLTRCFAVGRASAFYRKVYEAVKQAEAAAIKMVRAGVETRKVDAAAREVIISSKLPVYGHGTGHGLGIEVHEEPVVSSKSKGRLKAGQVITIEPAVYIPGKLGVRIEDDILVTKSGCRVLSRDCPHFQFI